jgi:hypothetical protein
MPSTFTSKKESFPFEDAEVRQLPVAKIAEVCKAHPRSVVSSSKKLVRLSENTIVKFGACYGDGARAAEYRNMQFVHENAPSVRLPQLIRMFAIDKESSSDAWTHGVYIVMEYVHGAVLSDCWLEMSEDRRQNVCDQVVGIISELQSLRIENPGPIGGGRSLDPTGLFSIGGAGPFDSISDLETWYNLRLRLCKKIKSVPQDMPSFNGTFGAYMVMSHLDIAMRNIIVQAGDVVCLIDWEFAGAYPLHFERAGLERQHRVPEFTNRILERLPEFKIEMEKLKSIAFALHAMGG